MTPALASAQAAWKRVQAAWGGLQARERRLVALAAVIVAAALLWTVALAPALATLRRAPAERAALQLQQARMQQLERTARALQAAPPLDRAQSLAAFQSATHDTLGAAAQVSSAESVLRVTLKDVTAERLADWLAGVRTGAHLLPADAQLQRAPESAPGAAARWSGTLSFNLPS